MTHRQPMQTLSFKKLSLEEKKKKKVLFVKGR